MKEMTKRGLTNAILLMVQAPEFERLRAFLTADASAAKSEADEIIKTICDDLRAHLVAHHKGVSAIRRGL